MSNPNGGSLDPAKLEVHPIAGMFPLMQGREFEELVEDIRANGLRTPILLDSQRRILDGRNRLRACRAAGVEPQFAIWEGGGSPLDLIVSLNLRRRHLNESQRAMLAAKLKETMRLEAAGPNLAPGRAATRAASLMNVSPSSVKYAAQVLRRGDRRLIQAVESGEVAVSFAAGARRSRPAKRALIGQDDTVVAVWARPDGIEEAKKLLADEGFDSRAVIVVGARSVAGELV
jgi:hypothetical protein